jgi:hypothetical protein
MTKNFQEGVLGSHKPLRGVPEAHTNPLHQENSPIELEILRPINFTKNHYLLNQISPEATGIPNQPIARRPDSLEVIISKEPKNTKKVKEKQFIIKKDNKGQQEIEKASSKSGKKKKSKRKFSPDVEGDQVLKGKGPIIEKHTNMIDASKSRVRAGKKESNFSEEKTIEEIVVQETIGK